jgi:hypothetical protein
VGLDGAIHWSVPLEVVRDPVALTEDHTLLVFSKKVVVFDKDGGVFAEVPGRVAGPVFRVFQVCRSVNLTLDGNPILHQHPEEEVLIFDGTGYRVLDWSVDSYVPAVYDDGTLAITGIAGRGFARMTIEGDTVWQSDFAGDQIPTVATTGCVAVAVAHYWEEHVQPRSTIFSPDGEVLGTYDESAGFAQLDDDWVALSHTSVARVTSDGQVRWRHPHPEPWHGSWNVESALVDLEGFVYVPDRRRITCYDPDGALVFDLPLEFGYPACPVPLAPGLMGCNNGNARFLIFGDD